MFFPFLLAFTLARTRTHTITPSFSSTHTHKHTHTVIPAGRWQLAWCCRQGILGAVCRKWWGVNWVNAGCKALWAKAWYSSSWCFVTHSPPHGIQVGKVRMQAVFRHSRLLFPQPLYLLSMFFKALWNIWCDVKDGAWKKGVRRVRGVGGRVGRGCKKSWRKTALTTSKQVSHIMSDQIDADEIWKCNQRNES